MLKLGVCQLLDLTVFCVCVHMLILHIHGETTGVRGKSLKNTGKGFIFQFPVVSKVLFCLIRNRKIDAQRQINKKLTENWSFSSS